MDTQDIQLIKQVTTIAGKVESLGAGQERIEKSTENFHTEMRGSIKELRENLQATLNKHGEQIADLLATRADFRTKISDIEKGTSEKLKDNKQYLILLCCIGVVMIGMVIYHLTGYSI